MPKSATFRLRTIDSKVALSREVFGTISLHSRALIASVGNNGNNVYVTAGSDGRTGRWHGVLMISHPTPSGYARWMRVLSDKRG
jgi:hypothetical protein